MGEPMIEELPRDLAPSMGGSMVLTKRWRGNRVGEGHGAAKVTTRVQRQPRHDVSCQADPREPRQRHDDACHGEKLEMALQV